MNIEEAKKNIERLVRQGYATKEDTFVYIESLEYLIEETKDPEYMTQLGGFYYGGRDFERALKYYEMAYECGDKWVPEGLGYIWYYGRTGKVDYEKAFRYYSEAAENGSLKSKIKIADMYKNGYFVEQDMEKYVSILEDAKEQVDEARFLDDPLPEVYTRLAKIRKEEGNTEEAVALYDYAREFLKQRIRYSGFFGDLNIMKWLIEDLYTIIPFEDLDDLYDLYWVLRRPAKVRFRYDGEQYEVISEDTDDGIAIYFNDKWYRTIDEFFREGAIGNDPLFSIYSKLYGFAIEE